MTPAEKIRAQNRERAKRWYWANREKSLARNRLEYKANRQYFLDYQIRYRLAQYGMTVEQFKARVESQKGKCACCGVQPKQLVVDHNHQTKEVRQLLCHKCNTAIGFGDESITRFRAIVTYLERWNGNSQA